MRSRAARLTWSVSIWIVFGAVAVVVTLSEQRISQQLGALRTFDVQARLAIDALAGARVAEQAYIATGQSLSAWVPKVASLTQQASETVDSLRSSAASADGQKALLLAASTITAFGQVDRRTRDYARAGQLLMAADIVFSEGTETSAEAARQIETARLAEHQTVDALVASERRLEAYAIGGSAGLAAVMLVLMAWGPKTKTKAGRAQAADGAPDDTDSFLADSLMLRDSGALKTSPADSPHASALALKATAELCTAMGRVSDLGELTKLLGRAAEVLDASGVIVWVGSAGGADLRPVLAYGYPDNMLARLAAVPRSADNAAAAAYRTGELQTVRPRPGTSAGAVVAPLLSAEGCIGAVTAEIRDEREASDRVRAVAALLAAQLAPMLAASAAPLTAPAAAAGAPVTPRTATA